ncbi:MAG: hypothetical protein QOE03_706, partial [Micromonosporaceae bacterium]|nr:hypothetical protein [Micromonosporaceae bacterium]
RRVRATRARELLTESLRLRRAASRPVGRTLLYLGDAAAAVGDTDEAKRCWAAAAEACAAESDTDGTAAVAARVVGPAGG